MNGLSVMFRMFCKIEQNTYHVELGLQFNARSFKLRVVYLTYNIITLIHWGYYIELVHLYSHIIYEQSNEKSNTFFTFYRIHLNIGLHNDLSYTNVMKMTSQPNILLNPTLHFDKKAKYHSKTFL